MNEDINIKLNVNTAGGEKTVGELKGELKKLEEQLQTTKKGSKEFNDTLKQIGNVKEEIRNVDKSLQNLNPEQRAQSFQKAFGSMAASVQGVTGMMGLMGIENKNLVNMSIALQGAMNFSNAIKDVGELKNAFNILKTALLSNPIMLIATVLMGIGIAIVSLKDKVKIIGDMFDWLKGIMNGVVNIFKKLGDAIGIYDLQAERVVKRQTESLKTLEKMQGEVTKGMDREIEKAKTLGKDTIQMEKDKAFATIAYTKMRIQALEEIQRASGKLDDDQKKQLDELKKTLDDTYASIELLTLQQQVKQEQATKEREKQNQEAYQRRQEAIKKQQEEEIKAMDDANKKTLENTEYSYSLQKKLAELSGKDTLQLDRDLLKEKIALQQQYLDNLIEKSKTNKSITAEMIEAQREALKRLGDELYITNLQIQKKEEEAQQESNAKKLADNEKYLNDSLKSTQENYDYKIQLAQINNQNTTALEIEKNNALKQANQDLLDFYSQMSETEKAQNTDKIRAIEKNLKDLNVTEQKLNKQAILDTINTEKAKQQKKFETMQKAMAFEQMAGEFTLNIMQLTGASTKKMNKAKFNIDKGMRISQAIIDTYRAITQALSSAPPPFNFVLAGISGAAGLAQVAAIKQAKYEEGEEGGEATASLPSASGLVPEMSNMNIGTTGTTGSFITSSPQYPELSSPPPSTQPPTPTVAVIIENDIDETNTRLVTRQKMKTL